MDFLKGYLEFIAGWAADNKVLICVLAFLLLTASDGWRKGFVSKLMSVGSIIITIIAEVKAFPAAMRFIDGNEKLSGLLHSLGQSFTGKMPFAQVPDSPLYDLLKLDVLAANAGRLIEETAVKVICFIAIFILVRLLLGAAELLLSGLKKIRIIDKADRRLGTLFGLAEGVFYVWLFMFIVSGFPQSDFCAAVIKEIQHSSILMLLYRNNLITQFAAGIFR